MEGLWVSGIADEALKAKVVRVLVNSLTHEEMVRLCSDMDLKPRNSTMYLATISRQWLKAEEEKNEATV